MTQKLDKDISENVWNRYLNKYKGTYKLITQGDGIRAIKCKYGEITPYSLVNQELLFHGEYKSKMKKTHQIKRILQGMQATVTQRGDCYVCIRFKESELIKSKFLMYPLKKRVISTETRLKLIGRIKGWQKKDKA